jgi:hypothetical protein
VIRPSAPNSVVIALAEVGRIMGIDGCPTLKDLTPDTLRPVH